MPYRDAVSSKNGFQLCELKVIICSTHTGLKLLTWSRVIALGYYIHSSICISYGLCVFRSFRYTVIEYLTVGRLELVMGVQSYTAPPQQEVVGLSCLISYIVGRYLMNWGFKAHTIQSHHI